MKIEVQNLTKDAKCFGDQSSGKLPLVMGGLSSIEFKPEYVLAYERHLRGLLTSKKKEDQVRLVFIADTGVATEIGLDQLLAGFRDGHFGDEAKALTLDWDARRAAHDAGMRQLEIERQAHRAQMIAQAGGNLGL